MEFTKPSQSGAVLSLEPPMAISNYSTTPGSNTAISGINIAEGCDPANINNAIRQLMADIANGPLVTGGGSAAAPAYSFTGDTNTGVYSPGDNIIGFVTDAVERFRLSGADIIVGASSITVGNNNGTVIFGGAAAGVVYLFRTAGAELFRFHAAGNAVGNITTTLGATAYNTSSDERMKENFSPPPDFGAVLDQIEVVSYDWKSQYGGEHVRWGIKAQTEYANIPEVIKPGTDGDDMSNPWAWAGNPLVAGLMLEVQKLRQRVAALEAV